MALLLTLVLSLLQLGSGQWQVVGPNKPVQALVGEDTVFTCFLSPEINAEAMEVRFFKDQFSAVVHLYWEGEDQKHMQMPAYQGRTVLVKDFIADGQVSLRLKNVTLLDAGLYGCWFSSQTHDHEAFWELQVSALGSAPLISIMGYVDGGIQLLCQSSGWFPQPKVKWKDPEGYDLLSDYKVDEDKYGLFAVETSFTFQENSGRKSCSIQFAEQSQEVESRIWIGDNFFQPSPWRLPSILLGLFCFGLCVGITGLIMIFFSKSERKIRAELNWRKKQIEEEAEWRDARKHAVKVTLDPDTAHPQLYISDLKVVTYEETPQQVPNTKKRFRKTCVVASQSFQTGKHYWEVDVGCNEYWFLGVCQDNVSKKDKGLKLSPSKGYWILGHDEYTYFTLNPDRIHISDNIPLTRVGIFLDYESGTISFFNINNQSFIYTLKSQFKGLLRPFIMLLPSEKENMTPVFICPVSRRSEREASFQRNPTSTNTDQEPLTQVTTLFHSKSNPQRESHRTLSFRLLRFLSRFQSLPADSSDGF